MSNKNKQKDDETKSSDASNSESSKTKYIKKRSHYKKDKNLPSGWTHYIGHKNTTSFRSETGQFFNSRRKVLAFMYERGGFSKDEIYYIRDGLLDEGWRYHEDLPPGWMYKKYTHKIEGLDTDILYLLSPNGIIYRSKIKIKRCAAELNLTAGDLQQLLEFKVEENDEPKKIDNPDDEWVYDKDCVPVGWRMKKYSYNSRVTNKVEEVFHYLTPDNYVLRGKRQVYDYMEKTETYNREDFEKFHFSKNIRQNWQNGIDRASKCNWSAWAAAPDLPVGWMSRFGEYKGQKRVQFKSPCHKKFSSRVTAVKFIISEAGEGDSSEELSLMKSEKPRSHTGPHPRKNKNRPVASHKQATVWDEWRDDGIPCLPGWQFSIGRKVRQRKIRYKSPNGNVFNSRGPLIRYLYENNLKSKTQLVTLKKLLKINQGKPFAELRKNDKFIKNFDVDSNYLQFLKIRYENESHDHFLEVSDPKLPEGWKKKNINGVDYFKDPTGTFVYNSRQLVVEHLKQNHCELSDDQLLSILEDSESESDLSGEDEKESSIEDIVDSENNYVKNVEILGI